MKRNQSKEQKTEKINGSAWNYFLILALILILVTFTSCFSTTRDMTKNIETVQKINVSEQDLIQSSVQFSKILKLSSPGSLIIKKRINSTGYVPDLVIIEIAKKINVNKTLSNISISYELKKRIADYWDNPWSATFEVSEMSIFTKYGVINIPEGTVISMNYASNSASVSFLIKKEI